MKKLLVVINGESGSGKDTFIGMCQRTSKSHYPFVPITNIHRSDKAKDFLRTMGWDDVRTPKVRKLLADLVDFGESTGYNNNKLFESVDRLNGIIFYHARDPKSISDIENHYWFKEDVHFMSLLMIRPKNIASETDRWGIKSYAYGKTIENNSTLLHLENEAEEFMKNAWKILEAE